MLKTLAVAVVTMAALVVACSGGGSKPATPSMTIAPALQDPRACPVDASACSFAEALLGWIEAADVQALMGASRAQPLPCYGPGEGAGGNNPLCDGAPANTNRPGFLIHRLNSDGGTAVADFRPDLRESILNGTGNVTVVGFHCPERAGAADCASVFVLFLNGAANLRVDRLDGEYAITAVQFGNFAEDGTVLVRGGTFSLPLYPVGVVPGRFEPWTTRTEPSEPAMTLERWVNAPLNVPRISLLPAEGPCPTSLAISGRGFFSHANDAKDPRVMIELYAGRVGTVPPVVRPRPSFTATKPISADGTFAETITLSAADSYVCAQGIISVVVGGHDRAVAYYRVK